jgi:dipeptidyl aminopeptidase/acylaminoacyl peptidase
LVGTPFDEAVFDYYLKSQLGILDLRNDRLKLVGEPGIFPLVTPSPNGEFFLVVRIHRPYSNERPLSAFPRDVEIWDRSGRLVHKVASLPVAEEVPPDGVSAAPREFSWHPLAPATLIWVEALDEGDPRRSVPHRDRVITFAAPFEDPPQELIRTEYRFSSLRWTELGTHMLLSECDRILRSRRTMLIDVAQGNVAASRELWSHSIDDLYAHPGTPIGRALRNGRHAICQYEDSIFLAGEGAMPTGKRPFLDRLSLKSLQTTRLFQSGRKRYEEVIALLAKDASRFIVRTESAGSAPNYATRQISEDDRPDIRKRVQRKRRSRSGDHALTDFSQRSSSSLHIKKELISYERSDGVGLSCVLYLPPNYQRGSRLPAVFWSYPREFFDSYTAGQIDVSTQRFTTIGGASPLFLLLQGYAVVKAAMPIIGETNTANDSYIDQIIMNSEAAIEELNRLKFIDRGRVGVGGHSYGATMTANLLAHTRLFRAGVALSGAYNRTLTPFGFQSERRALWQDEQLYLRLSPFMHADKIKAPLLLIHGESDNNPGTPLIQSQRMYEAISGNGGTARLVVLPHESHTYIARESVEHTIYEMVSWFDKYLG